ncbi:hypothetical protein WA026_012794 [Henosepilachna vigintioctopunctata]|uniref:Uncharacterized protein n=1 Tax=Henosepilachna vigintioctopunctata TaxID=420089 RepID=A0AAW1U891_9CUCU
MPLKTSLRKKINYASLKSSLASYDWNLVYNSKAAQDATAKFSNVIIEQILANTTVSVLKNRNIGRKEWITQGIIKSIITRDKLYKRYQRNRQNAVVREQFLNYRNLLQDLIKKKPKFNIIEV